MTTTQKTNAKALVSQNILVVGATGGTGRATIEQLVQDGHRVTAFSRNAGPLAELSDQITAFNGDATNPDDVDRAVEGHDAVIVTLGISENPIRVRLLGTARTPMDVRSAGTKNVISAMKKHGVRKLVVLSSYGVGDTREKLRFVDQLFFQLLLKPQIRDTEVQELDVRQSGVDWVVAQPVHLNDDEDDRMPFTSVVGEVRGTKIPRRGVARFLAEAAQTEDFVGQVVSLSAGAEA